MGSLGTDRATRTRPARLRRLLNKMSYCSYISPSVTCMKYQRQGCVEKRPFLPGERWRTRREPASPAPWRGCPQHLTTSPWWAQGQARVLGASSTQNRLAGLGPSLPLGGADWGELCVKAEMCSDHLYIYIIHMIFHFILYNKLS